ncbi:MAG: G-D-S-L family lipolytic protein [Candidatus Nealsonbacteria bacterium]|nr:G-D-S-L family lipolytic protein [Candidatus Nealsonbacteria bacterium]
MRIWKTVALSMIALVAIATTRPVVAGEPSGLKLLCGEGTPLKAGTKIALFGDSITMQGGYIRTINAALEASAHTKDLDVKLFQHGLNGGRVPTVLDGKSPWGNLGGTMQELIEKESPDLVVIFLGVNDVWHGEKGTSPEDFAAGLRTMVEMCKKAGARVVLASLAVIGEKPDGSNAHDAKLDRYTAITLKVAKETESTPLNVRKFFLDRLKAANTEKDERGQYAGKGILTYDGVHTSDKGNDLLANLFGGAIVEALKKPSPVGPK